jgi:hypothetical protein
MTFFEGYLLRTGGVVRLEEDLLEALIPLRRPAGYYAVGDYIRPQRSSGYLYVATSAGFAGHREPRWLTADVIVDGSVVWAPRLVGGAGLPTIASVTWTSVGASGLTIAEQSFSGYRIRANVSGGVIGGRYRVEAEATISTGEIVIRTFEVIRAS